MGLELEGRALVRMGLCVYLGVGIGGGGFQYQCSLISGYAYFGLFEPEAMYRCRCADQSPKAQFDQEVL